MARSKENITNFAAFKARGVFDTGADSAETVQAPEASRLSARRRWNDNLRLVSERSPMGSAVRDLVRDGLWVMRTDLDDILA